ncbi:hypothetical protein CNY89_04255, partial [Amaricoccus sp. HAR-UPW-R2A-40]
MTEAPKILLAHRLKTPKLPAFLGEYGKLASQCAAEGPKNLRFLAPLVDLELIGRERRMIERRENVIALGRQRRGKDAHRAGIGP